MIRRDIRRHLVVGIAYLLAVTCRGAGATDAATGESGPRPAVVILSGSKGFSSPAYAEIEAVLDHFGLDAVELPVLTAADLDAIARAGSARARLACYATRMPRWTEAVRAAVDRLASDPRHAGRVGVLGVSLGAQIAAAATDDHGNVHALTLVDGGFPAGYGPPRRLPPLRLIWGGADRVFPVATAQRLLAAVPSIDGRVRLKIYAGGAHDFFLQAASPQARSAWGDVAAFFALWLKG